MAQANPGARDFSPERNVMALLQDKLRPFNVPQEVLVALKEEIMAVVTAPETQKSGRGAVMTQSASMMGDKQRRGEDVPPGSARPTQF
jgi:hypothetical protein